MNRFVGSLLGVLGGLSMASILLVSLAHGFTPQTIVVDGVNDFLLDNRIEDDSGDTEHAPLDLLEVYITNDASKLYIGFGHDKDGWTTVQDGIMISTVAKNGATNDMWGRAISWSGDHTPGFGAYVNHDNHWQEFRVWTGTAWSSPLRAGPNANGMVDSLSFHEISFQLCELGLTPGDSLWFEIVITQDGSTKGPLDASVNDAVQLSTPGGTTWDTATPIDLPLMIGYEVQSAGDSDPPVVVSACKSGPFTIAVEFDEAVDLTTAENLSNYSLGGTGSFIVEATRTDACNVVELGLGVDIGAQASLYSVTVQNVQDLVGNTIIANGSTNKAEFALQDMLFRGLFQFFLLNNSSPPDTFSIEGNTPPLTFTQTCDVVMSDADNDSIYEALVEFCIEKDPGSTYATKQVEWKFLHNCSEFEPLGENRVLQLTSQSGAMDTVEAYWGDQDPSQFLATPIDVLFRVDMSAAISPGDTVGIAGDKSPLSFTLPSTSELNDAGLNGDVTPGDDIYSARLRFPIGTGKSLDYKFLLNNSFECADSLVAQGNRNVYLNDAEFDTLGGTLGELVLPVATYDYCTITSAAVGVVWHLKTDPLSWPGNQVDSVGVRGSAPPLSWDTDLTLHDDGVAPDAVGGDGTYSGSAVFAQGSPLNVGWKYTINDIYENGFDRDVFLNTELFDVGNPIVFSDTLDIDVTVDAPPGVVGRKLVLRQNEPNPFNPMTRIQFEVPAAGRYRLSIYNALGRRVRTLLEGELPAGPGAVMWNGMDHSGRRVGSGVYLYVLEDSRGGQTARKMMMLK